MRLVVAVRRTFGVLLAATVLTGTGLGYWQARGLLGGITVSHALGADNPRSRNGGTNILLIGLDSRKDQDGNDLPQSILDKLHAGDSSSGGYNTNTLILVHIGADDRVSAFSIPRDDYVAVSGITGYDHIKIKEAYGLTKAQTEDELEGEGVTDPAQLEARGREAGREATLRAVRALTGQPIDYFAEVNLAGFYDLAKSLGGIEVCLNHDVYDEYSGADFPAGRQTLNAAQALAFVRQRHGLENGDLDRTHRQQAFLLSVSHTLKKAGVFGNLDEFRDLMAVAHKDLVLSQGWGEEQFRRMASLADGNVQFRTLPVVRYDHIDGQDVNIIDPAAIRAEIAATIGGSAAETAGPAAAPDPKAPVAVVNSGDTYGLASRVADVLTRAGYRVEEIRDRNDGELPGTAVSYGRGAQADADALAAVLGIGSPATFDAQVDPGEMRVILGTEYELPSATVDSAPDVHLNESGPSGLPIPDAGTPIDGGGIPCVN